MAKYKNVSQLVHVVPNVGTFAPGDITPDISTPITSPDFEIVEDAKPVKVEAEAPVDVKEEE
jgi:hypothetical protein